MSRRESRAATLLKFVPRQQRGRLSGLPFSPPRGGTAASAGESGAEPLLWMSRFCQAEFARPYHHRVNEGLVQCSDCHNVHGTTTIRQVRTLPNGDAVCFKCHADKRGPFVYEHVPVKTEGCSSCHTPHGSTNPRLLRVSTVNLMCLQCHTFPVQGRRGRLTTKRLNTRRARCVTWRFMVRTPATCSSSDLGCDVFFVGRDRNG
jgi:predicted CXXCH cytochrome family protein